MANTTREELLAALTKGLSCDQVNLLQQARIAILGCGGLGSNIAIALTRAGVGHLHLIDFDRVELSNLNRQQFFLEDIGKYKVDALAQQLKRINPYIQLSLTYEAITETNLPSLLHQDNYICEALDNPETKAMVVSEILSTYPEKTLVAASGIAGIGEPNEIKTSQLRSNFYLSGDGQSDFQELPLCSARVMLCSCHEALTLIRQILGLAPSENH